jgi:predicted anti-sigma-YlaC factor YlaD
MKYTHITEILDGKRFAELDADDAALIDSHIAGCPDCREAFHAARISSVLLEARALEIRDVEPPPFFQAKVLNALRRENQNLRKPIAAFRRWWQASYSMVCVMLVTVGALIALTLAAPTSNADDTQAGLPSNLYPTDAVILNQRLSRDLTNEQVFEVIYNPRYDSNKK